MSNDEDTLRKEYPEALIKSGVRGKYTEQYAKGTNVILLDSDVMEAFPNSEAVNTALRALINQQQGTALK